MGGEDGSFSDGIFDGYDVEAAVSERLLDGPLGFWGVGVHEDAGDGGEVIGAAEGVGTFMVDEEAFDVAGEGGQGDGLADAGEGSEAHGVFVSGGDGGTTGTEVVELGEGNVSDALVEVEEGGVEAGRSHGAIPCRWWKRWSRARKVAALRSAGRVRSLMLAP
jgi:uncharacterized protein YodC (DUF2158 family)